MTTDALWCFDCKKSKPREEFTVVLDGKGRKVRNRCLPCDERIGEFRRMTPKERDEMIRREEMK